MLKAEKKKNNIQNAHALNYICKLRKMFYKNLFKVILIT